MNDHRRGFLRRSLLAAAVAPAVLRPAAALAIPPLTRKRPSHLKLSIAAYSYRQLLTAKPPQMDMFGFVDLAADLGFDAVEATSYYFPATADDAYFARFKRHAFLEGLDVSGTAIGNNFCVPAGEKRAEQVANTKQWIDRAALFGAPVIRVFAGNVPKDSTEDAAFGWVVECMNEVLPYAESKGIVLALENHGGITARPEQLLKFVQAIDHPNFGVNLDTANFRGEDPYADIAQLAPYAVNVQVKTEIHRAGGKTEEADFGKIVDILIGALYSGYVVIEYEAKEDPMTAIPRYAAKMRNLI
ncbi:sugar phosphate isomerase/epimerase family protein [Planctomyces sp. SH-PL62]|uniref:sugar phosphate isomerase/epimerase family protein n=1 Tax=Planctomyces sp. SH-PL62 TaxID=1636152 RepID=UPI00078BD797|nr:sugar phosphate isomerase/epimerase family protein [Planctomyces sp. SH-PL62]AMV39743.1 endonuclease 4 [Planctomyces sp. SH-PL62]